MKITILRNRLSVFAIFMLLSYGSLAQPKVENVTIQIAPDHQDWTYKIGEKVKFKVSVIQYGNPLLDVDVRYEVMPEKMEATKSGTLRQKVGSVSIDGGSMEKPGFLRCWAYATVNGKEYKNLATASFESDRIKPTIKMPNDFVTYWDKAKAENKEIPLDAEMTLMPELCTEKTNVYHVSIKNWNNTRIYGILCRPKAPGSYPAILSVPGAGVRPYFGYRDMAEEGIITFQIGIHGIPVSIEGSVYDDLRRGALNGYPIFNIDDKDKYYYKRVYLGCVRSIDFIASLTEYDGKNLAVTGGSQGGALSIVTAGLDKRVKYLAAFYPALCDVSGYLEGRAGGWPHIFMKAKNDVFTKKKLETMGYFDVVNFARLVTVPGWYSWGFNDTTCPPTSMYSAYNEIKTSKELLIFQDTGHWTYSEQRELAKQWLLEKLKAGK